MKFWFRWSLRDLRERWMQVLAIALIIALGTGVYSGLGGQRQWRESSYDQSYDMLHMFDLRLSLTEGSYLDAEAVRRALSEVDGVQTAEPRLVIPTLVDASNNGETILRPGRIIGMNSEAELNQIYIQKGRSFTSSDEGKNTAILDHLFARYYDLKPGDSLRVAGDIPLEFVGTGQSPEYFQIAPIEGMFLMGESSFAVIYMPLNSLQTLVGREGLVNDIVLTVEDGASRDAVEQQLEAVMAEQFPQTGFSITPKEEDNVYALMYGDAEQDQGIWNLIAFLFLLGAGMAAFNLAGRIVEAQRREIGIGMALGLPGYKLAIRPLLMGLQIALLGTVLGLVVGYLLSDAFANYVEDFMPLPVWAEPFSLAAFVRAALLGILIPFAATMYPVWRAVRVRPIDAIKTGYLVAKGGGLVPVIQSLPLPGRSFTQMPFRNLLRAPWRTLLTLLGISIAIILMVGMAGMLDSIIATLDQAEVAYLDKSPERMSVMLDSFYPVSSVTPLMNLTDEEGKPLLSDAVATVMAMASFVDGEDEIPTALELMDMTNPIWTPTLLSGSLSQSEGIVISEKTAHDLNVSVGDTVTLRHPVREGLFSFRVVETKIKVTGIHNNPLRTPSYMSLDQASMVGIEGLTNHLTILPASGVSQNDVRKALFTEPKVTSVIAIANMPKAFDDMLDLLVYFLRIVQAVVLVLAFLIAFNSTSINVDERRREIATMFAFGLRIRTVTRMQILENVVMGLLGTLVGIGLGYVLLQYLFKVEINDLMPEIAFTVKVSVTTILAAGVLGILVVSMTPMLSVRKMMNLNIPSTLRVME